MNIKKLLVTTKDDLLPHKNKIFQLFSKCFNSVLDENLWNWAYLDNPNGEPIVSLFYDEDELVGHYAVIQMELSNKQSNYKCLLSITTMVDSNYRRQGFFVEQAEIVYAYAKENNFPLVMGFPNKNSAPGFIKRLKWNVDLNSVVAKQTGKQIKDQLTVEVNNEDAIKFNGHNEKQLAWRLRKPNSTFINSDKDCLIKTYSDCADILAISSSQQHNLDDNQSYHIFSNGTGVSEEEKAFEYHFGYRILQDDLADIVIKPELVLSDVF